jgi:hypothetical protein
MSYHHGGLGQVFRAAEDGAGYFVTELSPYGILPAVAGSVPAAVVSAMRGVGFQYVTSNWGRTGRVWVRFYDPGSRSLDIAGRERSDSERPAKVTRAIRSAESAIGSGRLLLPGESPPAGVSPTPPPAPSSTPPAGESSMSTTSAAAELSATEVQRALIRAGFSVGRSGADGEFGTNSRAALDAAISRLGLSAPYTVSTDRRTVSLPANVWAAIQALPARAPSGGGGGGGRTPAAEEVAPPPPPPPDEAAGGFLSTPWPWVIGGVALAGAGAWLLLSSPSKGSAMAMNRRRRR